MLKKYKALLKKNDFNTIKEILYNLIQKKDIENSPEIIIYTLKNLKEGYPVFIPMICLQLVKDTADDNLINRLKKILPSLPPLTGFNDYRQFYKEFIHKYENSARGNQCDCDLFKKNQANPYGDKNLKPYKKSQQLDYEQIDYMQCRKCQRKWEIATNYSYHIPVSTWKELK